MGGVCAYYTHLPHIVKQYEPRVKEFSPTDKKLTHTFEAAILITAPPPEVVR